jgi:hypothetical protein
MPQKINSAIGSGLSLHHTRSAQNPHPAPRIRYSAEAAPIRAAIPEPSAQYRAQALIAAP